MTDEPFAPTPDAGPVARDRTTDGDTAALLESILEATHDGVLVASTDGRVLRFNSHFLRMFKMTPGELHQGGLPAIVSTLSGLLEDGDTYLERERQLEAAPSVGATDVLRFKDGRVYSRMVAPYRLQREIRGSVRTYRDITEQVIAQQALEQHRGFLEKAQEISHIGSWVAELDGSDRLSWSIETCRIFGVEPHAFSGTSTEFFSFVHPDDRDFVLRMSESALAGASPYEVEHRIVLRNGDIRWMHERADIIRDDRGEAVRMVGTVQDITERTLLEEQLRQAQKLEAIGRLAGGIAHDLNNALTAIAGYTELALVSLPEDHPASQDVNEIRRAAERAESVTRQLLAFSRKQFLEPRHFSLRDVVAGLSRLLERLLGTGIQVQTVTGDSPASIYGDPGQIEQAIINLAVNARDAMASGGMLSLTIAEVDHDEAAARTHHSLPPGKYVELSVADTGEGMDAETQAHVFEPFFTTKEVGKGTGLGLAMVYGTVRQSGGHVFVESERHKGTTFRLYFPAADGPPPSVPIDARRVKARGRATILVVEDEAAVRNLVVTALGYEGYRVLHASCGEEAIAIAETAHGDLDLLLTDAKMPGLSGVEVANRIVRIRPGLPVIVMSGYTDEQLTLADIPGSIPLLPKPFTPRELRQKVAEVLGPLPRQRLTS